MTTQTAQAPKLADDKFRMIRDLIYEISGMYFGDGKKYLMESRLAKRLQACGLKTYDEYYYFIKYDPRRTQEINRLFDEVTINETSFFRNPPQLDAFGKKNPSGDRGGEGEEKRPKSENMERRMLQRRGTLYLGDLYIGGLEVFPSQMEGGDLRQ